MKRNIAVALLVLCLVAVFIPIVTRASVTPYFMAVNDTLLPFSADTMPYVSSGEFFIPDNVFGGGELGVHATGSDELERLRLYKGSGRYVDFYTARGVTEDQDGNTLFWPAARRIGRRFYLPLRQVCDYFELRYEIIEVPRDIIQNEQMWIVRIISKANFNSPTFVGMNRNALRSSYNAYYAPPPSPSPIPTGGGTITTPPSPTVTIEPTPDERDVTVHLSFFDVFTGSAEGILNLLDIQIASGQHACFFVSYDDIRGNPGLIRRISGSGYTLGIMLNEGTFEEYQKVSELLFEAAKVKTVLVLTAESAQMDTIAEEGNSLIFWGNAHSLFDDETVTARDVTEAVLRQGGDRQNLIFSCSENVEAILPGVITFLRGNEYTLERITETVVPVT